jgi:chromosomal replication initiation ATPase DnaA
LASRIAAAAHARLDPPDDALLAAVLVKLFDDRGIKVSPRLIDWLVRRMDRSLAAAAEVVARLDAAALAAGSPVTRELAAVVLDNTGEGTP